MRSRIASLSQSLARGSSIAAGKMMRTKIRILLPLAQMVIAIALIVSNRLRPFSDESPAWTRPDWQIVHGLNAPAADIKYYAMKMVDSRIFGPFLTECVFDPGILVVLVGMLWYLVSIEIEGNGLSVLTPKSRMRSALDVAAIAFGAELVHIGVLVRHQFGGDPTTYSNLVAIPYFIWAAAIVAFYGHDFWARLQAPQ